MAPRRTCPGPLGFSTVVAIRAATIDRALRSGARPGSSLIAAVATAFAGQSTSLRERRYLWRQSIGRGRASTSEGLCGHDQSDGGGHGRLALPRRGIGPPGFPGPPLHRHRELHDMFYVLEGSLFLTVGDETLELESGSFACVPPGTPHTFANTSNQPVRSSTSTRRRAGRTTCATSASCSRPAMPPRRRSAGSPLATTSRSFE